jgi:hypothetical protein
MTSTSPETSAAPRKKRSKWLYIVIGVVVVLLAPLAALNFPLFLKVVSFGGTALFIFSIVIMLLTFRKAKKITPSSLAISAVMSLLSLFVYSFLLGARFPAWVGATSLTSGALIGAGWALTTPVHVKNGVVEREGTLWYLLVWGLIFAFNQLATTITGRPPQVAMMLLLLGTGVSVGNGGSLIAMFYRVTAQKTGR